MKRLFAAIFLCIIIVGACIIENQIISTRYERLQALISAAETAVGENDFDSGLDISNEINRYWSDNERLLTVFLNHSEVNAVGLSFARLPVLATENSSEEYLSECKTASKMLLTMREDEGISISSIF